MKGYTYVSAVHRMVASCSHTGCGQTYVVCVFVRVCMREYERVHAYTHTEVCMYIYIYIYIITHTYVHRNAFTHASLDYTCVHASAHVCMHQHMCACISTCVHASAHVCMHQHMCACISTCVHASAEHFSTHASTTLQRFIYHNRGEHTCIHAHMKSGMTDMSKIKHINNRNVNDKLINKNLTHTIFRTCLHTHTHEKRHDRYVKDKHINNRTVNDKLVNKRPYTHNPPHMHTYIHPHTRIHTYTQKNPPPSCSPLFAMIMETHTHI